MSGVIFAICRASAHAALGPVHLGLELSQACRPFGSGVTIIEAGPYRRLPRFGEVQRMSGLSTPLTSWQRAEHGCSAGTSDIDLFGYGKGVVDFDTEVAHRAADLLMPEQ